MGKKRKMKKIHKKRRTKKVNILSHLHACTVQKTIIPQLTYFL
jgi:hypothetical protein